MQDRTAMNYTWYSWATAYANETQQSITLQQLTGNLTMPNLMKEYHKFTPTLTHYLRKLQTAQINEMYTTFETHISEEQLFRHSEANLNVTVVQRQLQIAENTKFSQQQFIQLYARKLWRIHFIRQNILQKFLSLWKIRKFMEEINQTSFSQDEIYQRKMVGNKLFSWNRLRILGSIDYEHRYTIPELVEDQDSYWSPAKLVAIISGTLAAGTALAFGFYNLFFAESTNVNTSPFYAQVSLRAINNRT